jgi:hypothetical protein
MRQTELFHRHDVRIERVGLDDVRTGIKVLLMNAGDQSWLSQDEQVRGVAKIDRMIFEPFAAITLLRSDCST